MSWRKYFKSANTRGQYSPLSSRGGRKSGEDAVGVLNYPNLLQESYLGCPNRIERYQNFESMDQDSEINAALDILAEFSTQNDDQTKMCFDLDIKDELTETEIKIIKERLKSWYHLNELNKSSFKLFRNVLKYGDQVFLRDPETFKLFYMELDNVIKVIVNESEGKKPEQYIVRNIMPNFENLTVTQVSSNNLYNVIPSGPGFTAQSAGFNMPNNPYSSSSRFSHGQNEHAIDAQHVMHLSLTEGLDPNWPFGTSILENVFKVFKQKELLEDSIIIYRVQRAPERRVFKIDVGDMPSHLAMAFIDKVKNEIHQRRIPSFGEGRQFQDTTYFSLAPNADFFFPVTTGGRGSSVEQLPGGCLAMDTTVPLLDGRTLTIEELANEFNEGKQNWVYSCNPENGDIVPGLISWAGVTQKSATVLRITLDNGEVITATPDHKFPILEKGFVEASDLKVNDRLIPFNAKQQKISKTSGKYTQVYNPLTKEWEYVHRLVNKYFERNSKIKSAHLLLRNTPEFKEKQKIFMQSQQVKVDKKVIDFIQSMVIVNSTITLNAIVDKINSTNEILNHFLNINSNTRCANWNNDRITVSQIKTAVKRNGYKTWKQFKKEATLYNHSIISIEYLPEPIEVGTLTIDKDETYHNYHTFALSSGVFTKNSNLDEIKDLLYFNNKMIRALRIPSSYLPTGPDESERTLSDGKVGTALIQEFRFNQYCQRLQRLICGPLDLEFKAYMKWSGVNIDSSSFELTFNPPQNFAHYRQAELDAAKVGTFQSLEALPYMSKRFLMKRFLGLSEDELVENSKLWREEQVDKIESESNNPDFRSLGITPGGVQSDIDNFGSAAMPSMGPEGGAPPPEAGAGTAPAPPGGEAPPAPTV